MIFRAIQELLSNAISYSKAHQVVVQLDVSSREVTVLVDDNGRGFDPQSVAEEGRMGLKLIRDRVDMLGGDFSIDSVLGQGTRVSFHVPAAAG